MAEVPEGRPVADGNSGKDDGDLYTAAEENIAWTRQNM